MLDVVLWILYGLMQAFGFSVGTTFDVAWRRKGLRIFAVAFGVYLVWAVIVLANLVVNGGRSTIGYTLLFSFLISGATGVLVRRQAGPAVVRTVGRNQMLWLACVFFVLFLTLLFLEFGPFQQGWRQSLPGYANAPILGALLTFAAGAVSFLLAGLGTNGLYAWGVLQAGGRHLWCDFVSFHWAALSPDTQEVELVLVRQVWLNLLPNLKSKVKAEDRSKVDALVMQHLAYTAGAHNQL